MYFWVQLAKILNEDSGSDTVDDVLDVQCPAVAEKVNIHATLHNT